ncbi:MAG: glycerol-3-phosphate 1-O-acyltransferase PlsY [Alphaproteobacteria bacterium]|nr:glycerol-3-phosphate 1-O-acyltransferase PlsY [Alphaproteobacteria bacterium]
MPVSADLWPLAGAALGGYLLGSVPFALLLTRSMGLGDIRKVGSGNVGATNVLRTGAKGVAAATLLLDAGKGALAVLLAATWSAEAQLLAGAGAVVGHVFPVWLRFRGGKGVATTLGVMLAVSWPTGLGMIGAWLATALVLRYSSLAAIVAMAAAPLFAWWLADLGTALLALCLGVLVIVMHHENIRRLMAGEESRISLGKPRHPED